MGDMFGVLIVVAMDTWQICGSMALFFYFGRGSVEEVHYVEQTKNLWHGSRFLLELVCLYTACDHQVVLHGIIRWYCM